MSRPPTARNEKAGHHVFAQVLRLPDGDAARDYLPGRAGGHGLGKRADATRERPGLAAYQSAAGRRPADTADRDAAADASPLPVAAVPNQYRIQFAAPLT